MFALTLTPYRLLLAAGLLSLWSGFMAYGGWHECAIREEARQKVASDQAYKRLREETTKVNAVSAKLAVAETTIQTQIFERTKHVSKVTNGHNCLSSAAVGLLNNDSSAKLSGSPGKPTTESSSTLTASDTDVAYWSLQVQGLYDTCAARLSDLIEAVSIGQ